MAYTPRPQDLRAFATFDAKSQAALRAGQTVTGGDGRRFAIINGQAVVVGSPSYTAGMAERAKNTAARTTIAAGAKVPLQNDPLAGGAGPAAAAPVDTSIAAADAARNNDARARITSVLGEYGLESLGDFVWQQILDGKSDTEVLQDIRNTQQFKDRFPAIAERTAKGLAPISPGEYVAYERQARQIMRASGLPEGFYDSSSDFTKFLSGDVSISELNDRIQLQRQAVYEAPAEVRQMLMRDYGMTEGEMTAYFLDPDVSEPLLQKRYRASQIGGAASRTGFGSTSRTENERLADLGLTAGQAAEGFGALSDQRELFGSLPGQQGQQDISRDEQLGAAFEGNSNARRRIEKKRRERTAANEGGGQFASSGDGVVGLGTRR